MGLRVPELQQARMEARFAAAAARNEIDATLVWAGNDGDIVMLRAAVSRWRAFGTLDLPPGYPAGGEMDLWLEEIRQRRVSPPPPSWLRAVLGALGLSWPAMADWRDGALRWPGGILVGGL